MGPPDQATRAILLQRINQRWAQGQTLTAQQLRGQLSACLREVPSTSVPSKCLTPTCRDIIATCQYFGTQDFEAWAWRIPFLASFLLVAIAIYIRLQLQETPIFEEIKAKGQMTKNPWKEAFFSANIKYVLIASLVVIGQGVVWYSGQFWALYFLQQVSKVDTLTSSYIVGAGLLIGTPTLILFGWLSDVVGRKFVILTGFLLAAVTYYPLYSLLGEATRPGNIDYLTAIIVVAILVSYVGMTYGPSSPCS